MDGVEALGLRHEAAMWCAGGGCPRQGDLRNQRAKGPVHVELGLIQQQERGNAPIPPPGMVPVTP